ncbi:MAG: hypothetical protein IKE65_02970 [Clostridia bacterium]|nr:hypothetical protein [Clostridia bacterium]
MSDNILHLPTDETMAAGLTAIAQALENGGGSGGGGGAPAQHEHKLSDVYIPVIIGGDWDTNGLDLTSELNEALNNNDEAIAYMQENNKTAEDITERTVFVYGSEPIEDGEGNQYIAFMAGINKKIFQAKMAPNSSLYDINYGTVATIPETFDGQDLSEVTLTDNENEITVTIGEHTYPMVSVDSVMDLMTISSGQIISDASAAAELLPKYGGKTIVLTVNMVDSNGDPIPDESLTLSDIMDDEMLQNMLMVQAFGIVPVEDIAELMQNAQSDEDGYRMVEIHFDAIEEASIQKKPVLEKVAKMIEAGKLNLRTLASEEAYDNLDYDVKHDPNTLFLIQED